MLSVLYTGRLSRKACDTNRFCNRKAVSTLTKHWRTDACSCTFCTSVVLLNEGMPAYCPKFDSETKKRGHSMLGEHKEISNGI